MDNSELYRLNKELSEDMEELKNKSKNSDSKKIAQIDSLLSQFLPEISQENIVDKAIFLKEYVKSIQVNTSNETITLSNFTDGSQVLLCQDPQTKGVYRVKSKKEEDHYYLNPEVVSDNFKDPYIIGKIVMIEPYVAGDEINHFNLPDGTEYYLLYLEV